jgi:histidinol-phosphatase (PHP family)
MGDEKVGLGMNRASVPRRVSVHGGHSGEFCNHATDSLDAVVQAYIEQGFEWVGITEHMPAVEDRFRYPDEIEAGEDVASLKLRFDNYAKTCGRLKERYKDQIEILVAFETETYQGSAEAVRGWSSRHDFDYFVGSLHHLNGVEIDLSETEYLKAVKAAGSLEALYAGYFDAQHAMIESLKPGVIGHFDLVRYFDPDYRDTLRLDSIRTRVSRNLRLVRDLGLIIDVNFRGFDKPTAEQYPQREILAEAIELGVAVVPGDDSHGVSSVGKHWDRGIELLQQLGANCDWRKPGKGL